ncbi:MAG: hypothetical protein ACREN5_06270 [Gemmatimonadales bacterium]
MSRRFRSRIRLTAVALALTILAAPAASAQSATRQNLKVQILRLPRLPVLETGTTTLEVLEDRGPEFQFWKRALFVDWRGTTLTRFFRWSTKAQATGAVWQVTRFPAGSGIKDWRNPPGLVASGQAGATPAAGRVTVFSVNFGPFAGIPVVRNPDGSVTRVVLPKGLIRDPQVYYVRVVPLGGRGQPLGPVSPPVEITVGTPPAQPPLTIRVETASRPVVRIRRYDPVRFQDPYAGNCSLVIKPFPAPGGLIKPVYTPGQKFCVTSKGGSKDGSFGAPPFPSPGCGPGRP